MSTTHPLPAANRNAGLARQGFTLTEMLVAVGALALLALGVAEVFSLTTRTVAAGRRLSNLNAVASATERQMRMDFAAMTSRAPLVIRNQLANNNQPVEAYPGDPNPRPHRIDELVFFATGHYASQQQPVTADGEPVSGSGAMIYYGHGARQDSTANGASGFTNPVNVADTNAAAPALGVNTGPGGSKINRYTSEWTLVRRAFVLAPPSPQLNARVVPGGQGFSAGTARDSAAEINGLPAAPSPSWTDSRMWQSPSLSNGRLRSGQIPALSSGVVDIIAMDLRAVEAQLAYAANPAGFNNLGDFGSLPSDANQIGVGTSGATTAARQQAWMRTLLPADSDSGRRIRVEPTAPDFLNMNGGAPNGVSRADQLMLSSGAFLPRCNDFIVEYSFGRSFQPLDSSSPNSEPPGPSTSATSIGDVYWHGLGRKTMPWSPTIQWGHDTARYEDWIAANGNPMGEFVRYRDSTLLTAGQRTNPRKVFVSHNLIDPRTVAAWRANNIWTFDGATSYAFFGTNDPFYTPTMSLLVKDVNKNGQYDWADGDVLQEPESWPWARPTMIRITFTLSDPTDPTIEQTFQFVFDIPQDVRTNDM